MSSAVANHDSLKTCCSILQNTVISLHTTAVLTYDRIVKQAATDATCFVVVFRSAVYVLVKKM